MAKKDFTLTGWHVLGIFGGAFAVIISVNLALAFNAVRTFPGLETSNSYVSSQTFAARQASQEALGWTVTANYDGDAVVLAIRDAKGAPVQLGKLDATLGRATHIKDDRVPEFAFNGRAYVARETLGPGNWNIRLKANALDGTPFEQRVVLYVKS